MSGPPANCVTAIFQYDAYGRRTAKSVNGTTTGFLYDGLNVVQELYGNTPVANFLTGAIDEVFTRTDANRSSFLRDAGGNTIGLTDNTGNLQIQYTYEPFGEASSSGSANGNVFKLTGREDDGTGLYFYRARYYSPSLQRFVSEDPIGLSGGPNVYAYAGDNPISLVDPFGLKPKNGNGGGEGGGGEGGGGMGGGGMGGGGTGGGGTGGGGGGRGGGTGAGGTPGTPGTPGRCQ